MNNRPDSNLIIFTLVLAIVPLLTVPILWPWLRLTFFAPYLVILYYKRPLATCLWHSLLCGLLVDLFASRWRLGIHVATYCLTTVALYRGKAHFFEDKLSTLPSMTLLFAMLSTFVETLILSAFGTSSPFSWGWVGTDFVLFPLADAAYALLWFSLPAYLLRRRPSRLDNTLSFKRD